MLKNLYYLLLAVLVAASIYFYVELQDARSRLSQQTIICEQTLTSARDASEIRIAQLKYEYEQKLAKASERSPSIKLAELLGRAEERRRQIRDELLTRLVVELNLDDTAIREVTAVIEAHESSKQGLMRQIRSEGANLMDPAFLEKANAHREQALNAIRQILTPEQYDTFLQIEFDRKLDLRVL